jgi:hypothetical protein
MGDHSPAVPVWTKDAPTCLALEDSTGLAIQDLAIALADHEG